MDEARRIIERLELAPHPEGGWYRETWRADAPQGARAGGTAILFLLEAGQKSHWHRVDADESWLWHAGHPLDLHLGNAEGTAWETFSLGGDILGGYTPQALIPANRWQAAHAAHGWALVSCIVVPGFEFAGFELAPPNWQPGA
ncbi:cupin domain-containing protein [Stakelama tenebrarum]|uniref:Cupin domain-containing protein n=1 Tax=Stakelama tenebrarum TaxID=2711215 RepID=A0A6G6Y3R5_9SPHN|nr:cupin domain-containing protein [Sphingosinithalassobacter tenebrarum]QIG79206.1 cupin domain-containing protein [Sphingosinithalassobacter tenebrarum]